MPPLSKSQRRLQEKIICFERRVHTSLNFENMLIDPPSPKPTKKHKSNLLPSSPSSSSSPDDPLLASLFTLLPPELRDQIYTHLVSPPKRSTYIIAEDHQLFHYDPYLPIRPLAILPPALRPPATPSPLRLRLVAELATYFLATNTFYLRYRFAPSPLSFLTTPFLHPEVVPIEHLRRVVVIMGEAECADEEYEHDWPSVEFTWGEMLGAAEEGGAGAGAEVEEPERKQETSVKKVHNAKCDMFRERLEHDMGALAEWLKGVRCGVEEVVVLGAWRFWWEDKGAWARWAEGWAKGVGSRARIWDLAT